MKCPKCNAVLINNEQTKYFQCSMCSFKITRDMFDKIVAGLYKPKSMREDFDNNLSELNNL